jgi:protein involved in polysaccharide export with SLBB domain
MNIVRLVLFFAVLYSPWISAQNSELSSYKLGSGDMISIRVLGEDDLKRERIRLSDAGTISFPVLGEIRVKGMTVGALEDYVANGLRGRYLLNPQVTISIDEYRNFFVNGMVEKPGGYPFSPGLTVRKAISIAGGFRERAARDKINIIRDDDPNQTIRKVDLSTGVQPGDILTVEESFF